MIGANGKRGSPMRYSNSVSITAATSRNGASATTPATLRSAAPAMMATAAPIDAPWNPTRVMSMSPRAAR